MNKTIEITKVVAVGDTIQYEICDSTGLSLLKSRRVEAWVKIHHAEGFPFSLRDLPESILAIPISLYLLPATWFYGVDLVVPSMDKTLYECLPNIYETYSRIYGPFKKVWSGRVRPGAVVENKMGKSGFDTIVFFSGGIDAVHAGINNPGKRSVLVSVPSIEAMAKTKKEDTGEDFLQVKSRLIREFSAVSGSDWLLITNNFQADVFDDDRIWAELKNAFALSSEAFRFDGWFGMKYLGNLLSAAPFAYALGIRYLVVGSAFEQLEDNHASNLDGANPELSDSFKFAEVSFTEQDGLYVRRSLKARNIVEWCKARGERTMLWTCFDDETEQCGTCIKCVRTQLNILCAGENPADWGFKKFDEKRFSRHVRLYQYCERNLCWLWDIVDSIDDTVTYPYCDKLLHWLKGVGYKRYSQRAKRAFYVKMLLRIHRYPHYVKAIFLKLMGKRR